MYIMSNSMRNKYSIIKGLGLAMLSGMFFATSAVIVKKVSDLSPDQLAIYRFIGMFAFSLPNAVKSDENMFGPREFRFLLVLRGIAGATAILLGFFAFRYFPLGDASVIIFSAPMFVTVAARIFLKEQCGFFQWMATLVAIAGIIVTSKLPLQFFGSSYGYTESSIVGYLTTVGSLFFITALYIIVRKVKTVHHSIVVLISGWVSILETVSFTAILGTYQLHHCGIEKLYIIILGIVSYVDQTCLTLSLQYEQAGPVSTMRSATAIALGFLYQMFLFNDVPDAFSISGSVLVVLSAIFLILIKWVSTLSPESSYFKKLKWMTI